VVRTVFTLAIVLGAVWPQAARAECNAKRTPAGAAIAVSAPETVASISTVTDLPATGRVERFGGKLVLVLLDDKTHPSIRNGRSLWALEKPLTYKPSNADYTITVPAGFVTDLASIPRFAWTLLPPDGPWVKAAVVHDFLYATRGTGICWTTHPPGIDRPTPYTRAEADWILRDAMADRGVDVTRRNIIYDAVRAFGDGGWGS
jgi:hypothetical protein